MIRKELPHITIRQEVEKKEFDKVEIKNSPKPKKMNKLKSVFSFIRKTLAGQNKLGGTLHGILDLLPIPNQIVAKLAGLGLNKETVKEVLTVRNLIALIVSILIVSGLVSWEAIQLIIENFAKVIEAIKGLGI